MFCNQRSGVGSLFSSDYFSILRGLCKLQACQKVFKYKEICYDIANAEFKLIYCKNGFSMLDNVTHTIKKYNMADNSDHIMVALSGGADSCTLLHILQRLGFAVSALHVNHGLRGEESQRDQKFAESFCRGLNIPFYVYTYNVGKFAKDNNLTTEEAGRMLRYRALDEQSKKINATKIATAHNKNDNVETILLNLTRGTGLSGLRGVPPVRSNIVRPLIECTRKEIEEYCEKNNIQYVTDSTNAQLEYSRNKIRHKVLPNLMEINKNLISTLSANGQILGQEDNYLQQSALEAYNSCVISSPQNSLNISIPSLKALHPALQARVIRIAVSCFCETLQNLTHEHVFDILKLTDKPTGKKISLPMGIIAEKSYLALVIQKDIRIEQAISKLYYRVNLYDFLYIKEKNFYISCNLKEIVKEGYINTCTKCFNYDKIKPEFILRTRQQGDTLYIKNSGTQKLKNYLINKKIPSRQRDMPLLAINSHIIWVFGHYAYTEENFKNKIYIQIWEKQA